VIIEGNKTHSGKKKKKFSDRKIFKILKKK
jgi:hypothetical protein